MVDNVPIGPRVVGFNYREIGKPDAEYRQRRFGGLLTAWADPASAGVSAAAATVSSAAARMNAPRNRRTIPPRDVQDTQ